MAKYVNLLDRAPQPVIQGLNWVLVGFEDPVGLERPAWTDVSRHQGSVNMDALALAGFHGVAIRSSISWGYQDPRFRENWSKAGDSQLYRTSYHVIYPDQPVDAQLENWFSMHPHINIIPRVLDLELTRDQPASVIGQVVWDMSNKIARHDGHRPIIYSRYKFVDDYLRWAPEQLNAHYWILAQYVWDRTREHPGPPTLPKGLDRDRVILHQTADKKTAPPGTVDSYALDYDRWEIGNAAQMHEFIQAEWGLQPEVPLTVEEKVDRLWAAHPELHQAGN